MITGGDLRQSRLDVGYKTFTISPCSTWCPSCGKLLIERDGYRLGRWALKDGSCQYCNTRIAGIFEAMPGNWGPKRWPIEIK